MFPRSNKCLGQNFLKNLKPIKNILDKLCFINLTVIEIGSGTGVLTKEIIKKSPKELTLIELDQRFKDVLVKLPAKLIMEDCRKILLRSDVIMGNLPYYFSNEIIELCILKWEFKEALFMFQREFTERLCAKPHSKTYGLLSVIFSLSFDIIEISLVSRKYFTPSPKVDSSFIYFKSKQNSMVSKEFIQFLRGIFLHRRKKILNLVKKNNTMPEEFWSLRPDQITPEDYYKLWINKQKVN